MEKNKNNTNNPHATVTVSVASCPPTRASNADVEIPRIMSWPVSLRDPVALGRIGDTSDNFGNTAKGAGSSRLHWVITDELVQPT